MTDLTQGDHRHLGAALATAACPRDVYVAVGEVCKRRFGYILLTVLMVTPDGQKLERVWSSREADYPIGTRHDLDPASPAAAMLIQGRAFLAGDMAALRTSFPKAYAIIERLGIGFGANVPIVAFGKVLGKITLSDAIERDTTTLLDDLAAVAPYLVPALLEEARANREMKWNTSSSAEPA